MDELKSLWQDNKLEFHGTAKEVRNHYSFKELIDTCYSKEWVPHWYYVKKKYKLNVNPSINMPHCLFPATPFQPTYPNALLRIR